MSQYFPKPHETFGGDINVKVDLSNNATKADLHDATGIDTSKLATKADLVTLNAGVGKLDISKLVPVTIEISKLKDVVKNHVVKKAVYDKLVKKQTILTPADLFYKLSMTQTK